MKTFRLPPPVSLFVLALVAASPAGAQEVVQALPGSTDADALADDMRRLAANPRDVDSLIDAARLSLRLDDVRAAAALLQRAENVDPRNPRVRAGQASVLLLSERPGQALRYFAEAEQGGLSASSFAADRGMAYDLTGQQERAQRDYVRALRDRPDDAETTRRYALSLGISGQRQRALALLDPLVRRSDRAAWRAQAFVLAMTGDVGGASRIAATMMPGGAAGLSAFFARLPTLSPVDRAFAVHFGQVRASPERIADARMAPPVTPLPREPVVLASAQPILPLPQRNRRDRDRSPPVASAPVVIAAPAPAPIVRRAAEPLPPPRSAAVAPSVVVAARAPAAIRPDQPAPAARAAQVLPTPMRPPPAAPIVVPSAPIQVAAVPAASPPVTVVGATATPAEASPVPAAAVLPAAGGLPPSGAVTAAAPPVQLAAVPPSTTVGAIAPGFTFAPPAQVVASLPPMPSAAERPAAVARSRSAATAGGSEDSILARIVANLSIPAAELGIEAPGRSASVPIVEAAAAPARPAAIAVPKPDAAAADKLAADKAAAAKALADKRAAERKAAADKKVLAEKKAAAEKKALADKASAEKKLERANPERIWVQVAGGANEGDLRKAFAAVKAKAPTVFGARAGWTTPLRATNRVLTGPFKSDAEARAFVNDLKKAGVGAFTFTSDAGQPVKRLGDKGSRAT